MTVPKIAIENVDLSVYIAWQFIYLAFAYKPECVELLNYL